jgi:predicted nucleic acid-binding Zn ribbon protein
MLACYVCQHPFAATEPVYRCYHGDCKEIGTPRWSHSQPKFQSYPNICEACAMELSREWRKRGHCSECRRPIYSLRHLICLVVCSEDCNRARQTKLAKKLRFDRRIKVHRCEVCGTEFKATRSDASFCSVKCRVSSHRQRRQKVSTENPRL